ncbi:MAG TPA: hypothetical protein VJI12_03860 [archaeon]|nr:hypothetical protein [archaeon]
MKIYESVDDVAYDILRSEISGSEPVAAIIAYGVRNAEGVSYFLLHKNNYMVFEPDVIHSRTVGMDDADVTRFMLLCERLDKMYSGSNGTFAIDDDIAREMAWCYKSFSDELPTGKVGHV